MWNCTSVTDLFVVVVEIHGVKLSGLFVIRPNTKQDIVYLQSDFLHLMSWVSKVRFIWRKVVAREGSLSYQSYPERANFSHISLQNVANR